MAASKHVSRRLATLTSGMAQSLQIKALQQIWHHIPDEREVPGTAVKVIVSALAAGSLVMGLAQDLAKAGEPGLRWTAEEIKAQSVKHSVVEDKSTPGVQRILLSGDPMRQGPYVVRLIIPPNTSLRPHTHNDNRTATVVSGVWHLGYGPANTPGQAKYLPQGSFFTEPARLPLYGATTSEGAVIDFSGYGPTDTHFVNENAK